jgi:hypothetical protein
VVDTEDIGIPISGEVTKLNLSSSKIRKVSDHLLSLESSRDIRKEFDKSIIVDDNDIIIPITIHIFGFIGTDIATISCRDQCTDSTINSFVLDS